MALILSGTDGLSDVDGTAATPAIRGTDTNTGIFFPAADTIAFSEGGTEVARFDSSGRLGVGTTNPAARITVKNDGVNSLSNISFENANSTASLAMGVAGSTFGGSGFLANNAYVINNGNSALVFGTNDTERMRIDSAGNVMIGTTTSSFKLRVSGVGSAAFGDDYDSTIYGSAQIVRPGNQPDDKFHLAFVRAGFKVAGMGFLDNSDTFAIQNASNNSGNGVTLTNGATSWGTTSDERKKNIFGNVESALNILSDWRTVYYAYKNDEKQEKRVGLIAQDVQTTLPEAVSVEEDSDSTLQLRYSETIPVLVKAIQELKSIVDQQSTELDSVKAIVDAQAARIAALENPPVESVTNE